MSLASMPYTYHPSTYRLSQPVSQNGPAFVSVCLWWSAPVIFLILLFLGPFVCSIGLDVLFSSSFDSQAPPPILLSWLVTLWHMPYNYLRVLLWKFHNPYWSVGQVLSFWTCYRPHYIFWRDRPSSSHSKRVIFASSHLTCQFQT